LDFHFSQTQTQSQNKKMEIEEQVVECYSKVIRGSAETNREESFISDVRKCNNFVKALLFSQFVPKHLPVNIFDWSCGKGGDFFKLERFIPSMERYVGMDITPASIEHFRERIRGSGKDASGIHLEVQDLSHPNFPERFHESFYTVSCQIAFHYFCKDRLSMQNVIRNMSWLLAPGGVILLTLPNKKEIQRRLWKRKDEQLEYRVIDSYNLKCRIVQVEHFANGYLFELFDSPTECAVRAPEFYVDIDTLRELASAHDLVLKFHSPLIEFFNRGLTNAYLVEQFKVNRSLSQTDQAILSLYDCIVLEKRQSIQIAPVLQFL
jgi:SAM-dependent methyltransferase